MGLQQLAGHVPHPLEQRVDEAGRIIAEVRDTGGGIPEEVRPRILEPFFTTKPLGVGTGLGLSIVHGIVTNLRGELQFDSEVGNPPAAFTAGGSRLGPGPSRIRSPVMRVAPLDQRDRAGSSVPETCSPRSASGALAAV